MHSTHLVDVFEEFHGHLDEDLVLVHARLEALVNSDQLVDDLLFLAASVSLQGQHLSRLQTFFNFFLCLLHKTYQAIRELVEQEGFLINSTS